MSIATESTGTVEDTYELAPMQQGMLYHTLEAPRSGVYCIVVSYSLHGALDATAFIQAWQAVVSRHPVLRTSFHWRDRTEPVQMVHADARLDVRQEDWRGLSESEYELRLTHLLRSENEAGFDLTEPPLMRLSLIRRTEHVHDLVLTHHHLLMDGSCKRVLFEEVFALCEALQQERRLELAPPRPYRDFIEWLRAQDMSEADAFWRDELAGFAAPTPLWAAARPTAVPEREYVEHHAQLGVEASEALRLFGRRHRLTLNTIVSGMWALLLSRTSGTQDVVFGATVNGRPPELAGAESIVGVFINTLPVRVRVPPAAGVVPWLQAIQAHQAGARDYHFSPLWRIQQCSAVPRGLPLFQSIVVFENNAGYGATSERYGAIEINGVRPFIRNSLPLTLRCIPDAALSFQLLYDARRFSATSIASIGEELSALLQAIPARAEASLSSLIAQLDELDRQRREMAATAFERTSAERLRRLKRDGRHMRERP